MNQKKNQISKDYNKGYSMSPGFETKAVIISENVAESENVMPKKKVTKKVSNLRLYNKTIAKLEKHLKADKPNMLLLMLQTIITYMVETGTFIMFEKE